MYNKEDFTLYLLNYKDCSELTHLVNYFLNAGYGVSLPDDIEELRSYFYSIDVDFIIIEKLDEAYLRWEYMMFDNEHDKRIAEFNNEHRERTIEFNNEHGKRIEEFNNEHNKRRVKFNNEQFDLNEKLEKNMERMGYLKDKNRQVIEDLRENERITPRVPAPPPSSSIKNPAK